MVIKRKLPFFIATFLLTLALLTFGSCYPKRIECAVSFLGSRPSRFLLEQIGKKTTPQINEIGYLSEWLSFERPKRILVLLRNNYEVRTNGGFFGSYALVEVDKGNIKVAIDDIYNPDGKILEKGHISPPEPIQIAFREGTYRIINSDWDLEQSDAAKEILWFFNQAVISNIDYLVSVNFTTIEKIFSLVGKIEIAEMNREIEGSDFYSFLQRTDQDFFPGSTQKVDSILLIKEALVESIKRTSIKTKVILVETIYQELKDGQIWFYSSNSETQKRFFDLGLTKKLSDYSVDYFYINENNLGVNKANCCVKRNIEHEITSSEVGYVHKVIIKYLNEDKENIGGNYVAYMRILIPKNARVLRVENRETYSDILPPGIREFYARNENTLKNENYKNYKLISFFHVNKKNSSSEIELWYSIPTNEEYDLKLDTQSGYTKSVSTYSLNGKNFKLD